MGTPDSCVSCNDALSYQKLPLLLPEFHEQRCSHITLTWHHVSYTAA